MMGVIAGDRKQVVGDNDEDDEDDDEHKREDKKEEHDVQRGDVTN